ncbi:MAG: acetyltransferase [Myxococcales bacterium]|nr:acetyltransferase [Myxococcales bacterium]
MRTALLRALLLSLLPAAACSEDSIATPTDPTTLAPGESREVDLRYLRFDVKGFAKTNTLEQLRAMPRRVLQDVWLLDLDARPLMVNALQALKDLPDADVEALSPAAQNMRRLVLMTPDNAELEGTNLEELIAISGAIGIPPAKCLADLLDRGVTDPFIPIEVVADIMLSNVIGTHPNAQKRRGKVDADHPDGLYPVAPGHIPLTLADVVTNFEDMAERFGPVDGHPGFVLEARGVSVVEDQFAMTSKVTANALPFKGVDVTNVDVASVNSVGGQIETIHDFSDPEWMTLTGLVADPSVEFLSFGVIENDAFIPGGTSREPAPKGNSTGWDLPPWEFERLILDMVQASVADVPAVCNDYELGTGVTAFSGCMDEDGWVTLETFNGVGSPPPPAYIWDLELELAQVRLHDGGLGEGEADVAMSIQDVGVGVPPDEMIEQVKKNVQANPEALREFASLLTDSTAGAADFYYVRGIDSLPADQQGDWLFFVTESDIAIDDEGNPVRDYGYTSPGFFTDPQLTKKVSDLRVVDGDETHEKVRIAPGDVLYVEDDDGVRVRIEVLEKPSRSHLALGITRMQ